MSTVNNNNEDTICGRSSSIITIGVVGGSGAGKTTLAEEIYKELGFEKNVTYLTHDDYYKDISHKTLEERAKTNFDHPDSLDTDLLIQHVIELKQGKSVQVPNYDFSTHSRLKTSKTKTPNKIILVEGILIFSSEKLRGLLDVKVFVDADSDSRFMRRLKRDTVERGRSFESVMEQYKKTVRPMHDTYVEPYKLMADIIVPSERLNPVGRQCIVNYLKVQAGLL